MIGLKRYLGAIYKTVRDAARKFAGDDAILHAAALAFYTMLSLAPLLVLAIWALDALDFQARESLVQQVTQLAGPGAGDSIRNIATAADARPDTNQLAGYLSMGVVLLAGTGIFVQLQKILNRVWGVRAVPSNRLLGWLRKRLISLVMMLVFLALLLALLATAAVRSYVADAFKDRLPGGEWLSFMLEIAVTFLLLVILLGLVFRMIPDVTIASREVVFGACVTAGLLTVGNLLLGWYLARSGVGSRYGAAGSLVMLMLWAYYSWLMLLFGAEITQVHARMAGREIVPNEHAERD
jgi:membrane protein